MALWGRRGVHFHPQLFSQRHTLQRKTCLLIVNHKSSDSESPFACVPMVNRVSATSPMVITDLLVVIVGPQKKKKKGRVILLHKGLCLSFGTEHAGGAPSLRQGSGGEVGRVGEFLWNPAVIERCFTHTVESFKKSWRSCHLLSPSSSPSPIVSTIAAAVFHHLQRCPEQHVWVLYAVLDLPSSSLIAEETRPNAEQEFIWTCGNVFFFWYDDPVIHETSGHLQRINCNFVILIVKMLQNEKIKICTQYLHRRSVVSIYIDWLLFPLIKYWY